MSVLYPIVVVAGIILGLIAARGSRAAYIAFVVISVGFMPARAGFFHFSPHPCDLGLSVPLVLESLTNYSHIILFAAFFLMTRAQFPLDDPKGLLKATLLGLAMGIVVELEQALLGRGQCQARALIPDLAGLFLGAIALELWRRVRATKGGVDTSNDDSAS